MINFNYEFNPSRNCWAAIGSFNYEGTKYRYTASDISEKATVEETLKVIKLMFDRVKEHHLKEGVNK